MDRPPRDDSVDLAEEAMEVDSSDNESNVTVEDTDKRKSNESKSSGYSVKNKLLLFKFDSNKKSKPCSNRMDKNNEDFEEEDDVVDISNEVLVGDLNKKKRKRKNSSESKIKKKRKSIDKTEKEEIILEGREELKENFKDSENVLKDDKEKVNPDEKCSDKKETALIMEPKKSNVDGKKDNKSPKCSKINLKKSPNPRNLKSNEGSGIAGKPLLTMDKFIIRKKTLEELEQEKLTKQNKKKIVSDEIIIVEDDDVSSKEVSCYVKNIKEDEMTKDHEEKCDSVEKLEFLKAGEVSTDSSEKHNIKVTGQVKVETPEMASNLIEKSTVQTKQNNEKECDTTSNVEKKEPSGKETKKELETLKEQTNVNYNKESDNASHAEEKKSRRTTNKISPSSKETKKESKEQTTENNEKSGNASEIEKKKENSEEMHGKETGESTSCPNSNEDVSHKISNNDTSHSDQSTPSVKRRQSMSNKTPKTVPQKTLEPKKLTPKQIEKNEELARKKEELTRKKEEKEQEKERLRLEKEQKKFEEEEKKRKEREEKEETKRVEKETKEKQRKEQEELRKKERESKEQLRLIQIETKNKERAAREDERKAREDERRKKEEAEKEKKEKAAAAFASFFVPKKGGSGGEVVNMEETSAIPDAAVPAEKQLNFMPFQIKGDMRMAPTLRSTLTPERSAQLDSALKSSGETRDQECLYLRELKRESYVPGKGEKTWPPEIEEEPDVIIVESEFSEGFLNSEDSRGGFYNYPTKRVKRRAKLLQFHDNRRPPYFGTWSKKTKVISGRTPFKQDEAIFEYDVDSDDEWEEEGEGESLRGSEDEGDDEDEEGGDQYEVDNQMFVPHGYLSDEEEREDEEANVDPEAHKIKLKLMEMEFEEQMKRKTERLQPRLIGCVYLSNSGTYSTVTVGNHIRDLLLTRRAVYLESSIPITTTVDESAPVPLTNSPPSGGSAESAGAANEKLTSIPDCEMVDLIKLVHGSYVSRKNLSKEFNAFLATSGKDISLALIQKTIREIAEWVLCPLPECAPNTYPRKCWFVKVDIREKFGLGDFLACQNSWKFIVEPATSEKRDSTGNTPTARKELATPTTGRREQEADNTPTSSRRKGDPCKTPKRKESSHADRKGVNPLASATEACETASPPSGNGEKEVCGESTASSRSSLITKFTKVLSEEERREQLNKNKVNTIPKTPKMMPKSKLELFKVKQSSTKTTSSPSTTDSPTTSTPVVKKRATLISVAKTAEAKLSDTTRPSPSDAVADESVQSRIPADTAADKNRAGQTNLQEVIALDEDSNEETGVKTDQDKVKENCPSGVDKPKTPQSASKANTKKKTPKASGKKTGVSGAGTTKSAAKAPLSAGKTSSNKAPNSDGKKSTNVSIVSFMRKDRTKRKPDDEDKDKEREEESGRKKAKLGDARVDETRGDAKTIEVECVQIESSNEGW